MKGLMGSGVGVFAALFIAGCATSTSATTPPTGFEKPDQMREAKSLTFFPIVLGADGPKGKVEGREAPTLKREDKFWSIETSIGTGAPVVCRFFDEPFDAAETLTMFSANLRKNSAAIAVRSFTTTDVGVVGEDAYIMVAIDYTKQAPTGAGEGQIKVLARSSMTSPLLCFHDEVGYHATFKRVALGLAKSLNRRTEQPVEQSVEIQFMSDNKRPVGFRRTTFQSTPACPDFAVVVTAALWPGPDIETNAADTIDIECSDGEGRVLWEKFVETAGGQLFHNVTLKRGGAGRLYDVSGEFFGKKVEGHFEAKDEKGLASIRTNYHRLRDTFVTGAGGQLLIEQYDPDFDPLTPATVTYAGSDRNVTYHYGPHDVHALLDESGIEKVGEYHTAQQTLHFERLLMRGH
jgi:hypothetical protein